jgi:hypothetical protein
MEHEPALQPVATVTGLYRGTFCGLEPLTKDTPLTPDEVRRSPIFYELALDPAQENADLIIDVIYDNLTPIRMQDLYRGTDIPRGVRFWPDWFDIPHYREMRDIDGRRLYPRAPGTHTVRIRTACRPFSQIGKVRDFSPASRGYTSPLFEFTIAADENDVRE